MKDWADKNHVWGTPTMHNLPHRAQVMTTFKNEIPLKMRQGTVLHFRISTNFVCLTR